MSEGNGKAQSARLCGTIKWFNAEKGYGFITRPADFPGDKDIFLHAKALPTGVTSLTEGTVVSFQIENGNKGVKAVNVQLA